MFHREYHQSGQSFRLPKDEVVKAEVENVKKLGVKIETNVIVEFEIQDGLVHEKEVMYFKPKILIKDMIQKVVNNFNTIFKEKNKNIYLRPEGINYKLCECRDFEVGPGTFKVSHVNYLDGFTKLIDTNSKNFRLYCDPHDVILNFRENKGCNCLII